MLIILMFLVKDSSGVKRNRPGEPGRRKQSVLASQRDDRQRVREFLRLSHAHAQHLSPPAGGRKFCFSFDHVLLLQKQVNGTESRNWL